MTQLLMLALNSLAASEHVDSAMLRGCHEPGTRIVRHARFRPSLERGDQSVLGEVFSETDVANDSRQTRDQFRGLDSPDCINCTVGVGSRHGFQSHHLHPLGQGARARCYALAVAAPNWDGALASKAGICAPYVRGELSVRLDSPLRCCSLCDDVAARPR